MLLIENKHNNCTNMTINRTFYLQSKRITKKTEHFIYNKNKIPKKIRTSTAYKL